MISASKEQKLSKTMSYILRHKPSEYGITLDKEGFCLIQDLVNAIKTKPSYNDISDRHIKYVVDNCSKKRYEIVGDKIRALYGHSLEIEKKKVKIEEEFLYHIAPRIVRPLINKHGIKNMGRQYVHLVNKENLKFGIMAAKRRSEDVDGYKIDVQKALEQGVTFYEGGENVFLSTTIPPSCLELYAVTVIR